MSYHRDKHGKLLPDGARLNEYGKFLRFISLDELVNIIKGDMSVVGPSPQLVCDMVFMTAEERKQHPVLPCLTGLAQCYFEKNGATAVGVPCRILLPKAGNRKA